MNTPTSNFPKMGASLTLGYARELTTWIQFHSTALVELRSNPLMIARTSIKIYTPNEILIFVYSDQVSVRQIGLAGSTVFWASESSNKSLEYWLTNFLRSQNCLKSSLCHLLEGLDNT